MRSLQHPCHPTGQRPSPWIPVSPTPLTPWCKDPALRPGLAQPSRALAEQQLQGELQVWDQRAGERGGGPRRASLVEAEVWAGQVPAGSLPREEPRAADSEVTAGTC